MSAAAPRNDLTIMLTLKGREDFTPRWVDYHSHVGLPWPVIVGDGAPSDHNEALFARAAALRVAYRRYDDRGLLDYYRKLHDLVAAIQTPYVMMSDNDDFVLPDGVSRSISFLNENPDYVSCSGLILGMYITDHDFADKDRISGGVPYQLRSIYDIPISSEADVEMRVVHLLHNYVPTWYAVHRRDALLKVFADLVERQISDVGVMELLVGTELAALGKQKVDFGYASYLRQLNSSQGAGLGSGLLADVLSPSVERDIDAMAASIAAVISDESDEASRVSRIRAAVMAYRRENVSPRISSDLRFKHFVGRYVHTLRAKVSVLRPIFAGWERRRVLARLRVHGATEASRAALREELDMVWHCAGYRA